MTLAVALRRYNHAMQKYEDIVETGEPASGPEPERSAAQVAVETAILRALLGAGELADRIAPPAERELLRRALALSTPQKLRLVRRLWRDERAPALTRLPLTLGAAYLVTPIRFTPKRLAPVRRWEKVLSVGALLWLLTKLAPEPVLREHIERLERPGLVSRTLKRKGDR